MRPYSAENPLQGIPFPPDTVNTLLITGGSSGQAMDWPSTLSQLVRVSFISTAGVVQNGVVNLLSTHAAAPSSGSSVTTGTTVGSTGNNLVVQGTRTFQIPAVSTGFSVYGFSSGLAQLEIWHK